MLNKLILFFFIYPVFTVLLLIGFLFLIIFPAFIISIIFTVNVKSIIFVIVIIIIIILISYILTGFFYNFINADKNAKFIY